jgi:hypothetical protein
MKQFITDGIGSSQTLDDVQNEKLPVYDTIEDAQDDLANLAVGQIISTKSINDVEYGDVVEYVNNYLDGMFTRSQNDSSWVNVTSSMSTQSGYSSLSVYARRKDNFVEVKAFWSSSNGSSTATTGVATGLPAKYRPTGSQDISVAAYGYSQNGGNGVKLCRATITTGGGINESERFISEGGQKAVNAYWCYFV